MNSILRRRRAMISAQTKDVVIPLDEVPIGALVSLSGYNFVNIGVVDNASLLLRERLYTTQRAMGKSSEGYYDYDGCTIDKYLMGSSVYGSYSTAIKNKMINLSITYPASNGEEVVDKTIQRKIFLPTYEQCITDGIVLNALKICYNTDTAATARIAKVANGTANSWWTMSAASTTAYRTFTADGNASSKGHSTGGIYVRPMIAMDKSVLAKLVDGVYVCSF